MISYPTAVALVLALLPALGVRAAEPSLPPAPRTHAPGQCLPAGAAFFKASLRGALSADLDWSAAQLQCDGGERPEGKGLRLSIAGPLAGAEGGAPRRLRFVFGIDTTAGHSGLPTNLTLLVEGEGQVFATRGDVRCTTDSLQRDGHDTPGRVDVRGFCTGPATSLDGSQRVLLSRFDFSARLSQE